MFKTISTILISVFLFGCAVNKEATDREATVRHDADVSIVKFAFDSSALTPTTKNTLDIFIETNNKLYPDGYVIGVVGRTDYVATDSYNIDLGLRRAKAVKAYLKEKGVVVTFVQSMGESDPVVIKPYIAQNFDNIAVRETNRSVTLITIHR